MFRFVTRDGQAFSGESAAAAVDALRATSRNPGRDRSHFLAIVAEGARMQTGRTVRPTDCATLLADLEQAGLIERVN